MPNMGGYKPKNAHQYNNTKYRKKTSEHGHYEPEITGKRYGRDGSMANFTTMNWVEDNRELTQAAPVAEPKPEPEPAKEPTPVEHSPEVKQAKERVNNYKQQTIDGTTGSDFSTEGATAETNGISFEPGKTDTQAYNPNAGNEEEAQGFADKYKLNLINKGAGQSDFSAV